MTNYNCEGHPRNNCSQNPEVRVLPSGGDSNSILCYACFFHEIRYRVGRNKELSKECQFKLPKWEDLEVYSNQ